MHKNKQYCDDRFASASLSNEWMVDFMMSTRPVLFSVLLKLIDNDMAEEIAQEAYLKVFIAIKASRADNPSAYLIKVAKNLAFSRLRHIKVEENHALNAIGDLDIQPASQIKLEDTIDQDEQNQELIHAINQLPPACRQVFIYRKLKDKSHSEIAKIMHISTKTVENHLSKGMLLCRKYMLGNTFVKARSKKGVG